MSDFKPGEIVDITIKGARVVEHDDPELSVEYGVEGFALDLVSDEVTVERVAPAEWPPRPGDLWRDRDGDLWLGRTWQSKDTWRIGLICARHVPGKTALFGGSLSTFDVQDRHGPLTFVHREDES